MNWLCSYLGNRQYVNDICNISKILDLILFADDTNLFCTGDNLKDLSEKVCEELTKLNIWFALNKLSLNVSKTNYMVFGNRNIVPEYLYICMTVMKLKGYIIPSF